MNTQTIPSLTQEYDRWLRNNYILETVYQQYNEAFGTPHQWKAALENALMYTALEQKEYNPDLVSELTPTRLLHGLHCVDLSLEGNEQGIHTLHRSIENASKAYQASPQKNHLSWNSDEFKYGAFSLQRNSYLDKAFKTIAKVEGDDKAAEKLLIASLRYASIFAETRHIGPPQSVYNDFYDWGVRNEGFASPFNARLLDKKNAKFYSLFPDTDKPFGSGGSFFHLSEPVNEGHWSLDPPFLPEIMRRVDSRIKEWRQRFPQIAILYIIPQSHTPAFPPDETVTLQANQHYYEGLDGKKHPLPVNVCVHRYGRLDGFEPQKIIKGYEKE
jgi:hypothetical protein